MLIIINTIFLILLVFCSKANCQNLEQYLSNKDKGYQYIEALQAQICSIRPHANCNLQYRDCELSIRSLYMKMFNQIPSDSVVQVHCQRVTTRFEVPGAFLLLSSYCREIELAASQLGIQFPNLPRIGTLPIKEINASSEEHGYNIIFINSTFMTFANEIMKVISRSIDIANINNITNNDELRKISLRQSLAKDSSLLRDFLIVTTAYVEGNPNLPRAPANKEFHSILSTYLRGIELFAIAHEYAHIYMGHTKTSPRALVMDDGTLLSKKKGSKNNNEWAEEMIADFIALKILKQIYVNDLIKNSPDISILFAPEFYFTSLQLLSKVRALMLGETEKKVQYKDLQFLPAIKRAFSDTSYLSMELQLKSIPSQNQRKHPPTEVLRQDIVHYITSESFVQVSNKYPIRLTELLSRNTFDMWELASPSLDKLVKKNKKEKIDRR